MSGKNKKHRSTLADALDAMEWDYKPGEDPKLLLRPVGMVFSELPWEVQPQYLGPAPIAEPGTEPEPEAEVETDPDEDADTQPIKPIKK